MTTPVPHADRDASEEPFFQEGDTGAPILASLPDDPEILPPYWPPAHRHRLEQAVERLETRGEPEYGDVRHWREFAKQQTEWVRKWKAKADRAEAKACAAPGEHEELAWFHAELERKNKEIAALLSELSDARAIGAEWRRRYLSIPVTARA